jgi:hypothetical protein
MVSKEMFRPVITVVLVVVMLAGAVYYSVPDKAGLSGIVFALGPGSQLTGEEVVSELPTVHLIAIFSNNSYTSIFDFDHDQDVYVGEVDAKDLTSINISLSQSQAAVGAPYDKLTVNLLDNRTVHSLLIGNETVDLGMSQVVGHPNGFMAGNLIDSRIDPNNPGHILEPWPDLPINACSSNLVNTTGHWGTRWGGEFQLNVGEFQLNVSELQEVLGNGFYQVNVTFNLSYDIMLRYELVYQGDKTYGDASLHWSGEWGTIQFIYDQNGLTSMKYDFRAIKLVAFPT